MDWKSLRERANLLHSGQELWDVIVHVPGESGARGILKITEVDGKPCLELDGGPLVPSPPPHPMEGVAVPPPTNPEPKRFSDAELLAAQPLPSEVPQEDHYRSTERPLPGDQGDMAGESVSETTYPTENAAGEEVEETVTKQSHKRKPR